jgi:hypothetical protein
MDTEALLDSLLTPRPNGSEALTRVASFIEATLREHGAEVTRHTFMATPWGFQLLWSATLLLALAWAVALALRRYELALLPLLAAPALMLVEMEFLWSPVSGLLPRAEDNVIGTFVGRSGGATLIFSAHYDTATHFGDHFDWYRWGMSLAPALLLATSLTGWGILRGRVSRSPSIAGAALVLVPFVAMAWCFSIGPLIRAPSPGALDNGGAVVVLLRLAERLAVRTDRPTTVKLVFLAAEEERALGSWEYARTIDPRAPVAVINLETIGATGPVVYAPEEGFQFRRYPAPGAMIGLASDAARELWGEPLAANPLPAGVITDGRSFLAHDIPAVTLLSRADTGFPRCLHSARDDRRRLSLPALEKTVDLLAAIVARVDRDPAVISRVDLRGATLGTPRRAGS